MRLKAAKVSQKTLDAYHLRIGAFNKWAAEHKLKVTKLNLDSRVVRYMTWLYDHDDCEPWTAAYLIYGLQLLKCTVPKADFLPNAKEALTGWKKLRPGLMRLPVPEEFVFDVAIELGATDSKLAALVLLQFDCYLRPSEALGLTKDHLVRPAGPRYPRWGLIVCLSELQERTKTGTTDDSLMVGDVADRSWMSAVMSFLFEQPEHQLFGHVNLSQYEKALRAASKKLGYTGDVLQPHILRHSGASNDRSHERRSLPHIQKRGRWAAKKSVLRYEKAALMQRQWKFAPKERLQQIQSAPKRLRSQLHHLLRQGGVPPTKSKMGNGK